MKHILQNIILKDGYLIPKSTPTCAIFICKGDFMITMNNVYGQKCLFFGNWYEQFEQYE